MESDLIDPLCQGQPAQLVEGGAERAQEAAEAAASCSANQPQPHPWIEGIRVTPQKNNLNISPYQVLMQQSSPGSIQSEIDEVALKDLLQLVPNRPRLTGLKLCLADLRRDVKELNLQLGDRYWKYSSHYFTLFILLGLGVPPQQDL